MTEKEKIELQRGAYTRGMMDHGFHSLAHAIECAKYAYPMPKQFRTISLGNMEIRYNPDEHRYECKRKNQDSLGWNPILTMNLANYTPETILNFAHLKSDPYIEVDDD